MSLLSRRWRQLVYRVRVNLYNLRWILLSAVLATVGLLSIWFPIPIVLNVVLAVVSIILIVPDVLDFRRERGRFDFQDRTSDEFDDVREWVADHPRFVLLSQRSGTFLLDKTATASIADGVLDGYLGQERYELPSELAEAGEIFLERRIAGRLDVFDGPVVGIDSDLGAGADDLPTSVRFVPASYFDHLSSDLFAARDVHAERRHVTELGRGLVVDRHGRVRDFGESWLLNAVGVSVVGITSDGWIVNVHQTAKNESSPDLLAPSGSGSLEPADFGSGPRALARTAIAGAVREMQQESGIGLADVDDTAFLGFGRWLEKGGKPELLSVALLTIDSHAARRRRRQKDDRPYSKFAEPCRLLQRPLQWDPDNVSAMVGRDHSTALSLPLQVSLTLMARAAHSPGTKLHNLLNRLTSVIDP